MRWSLKIGRIFGITIRLHVTFLLLLAAITWIGFENWGLRGGVWSLIWVCSMFTCIVLHELGHSVVAQQLGVEVKSITLLPIGGVAALKRIPENPWHEIAITLAGPMVNLAIAVALLPFVGFKLHLFSSGIPENLTELRSSLADINITLFVFNFIPAFPMDGGRLLRALLATVMPHQRATAIAATVGQGLAILFVMLGLTVPMFRWLILIGVFIFIGADGENKWVRQRGVLRELDVDEVMNRDFAALSPFDLLARGLELLYQTGQDSFLVTDDGRLIGTITREVMVEAANKHGPHLRIADVMNIGAPVVSPQAKLSDVYEEMMSEGHPCFPVMQDGEVVGLITIENISRYLLVHSSLKTHRRVPSRGVGYARMPVPPPVIASVPPIAVPPPLPTPARPADPA